MYNLSFCKVNLVQNNIAEFICDKDVEINHDMVDNLHNFLLSKMEYPFSVLVNKVHPYSLSFRAQREICVLNEINAIAIVYYDEMAKLACQQVLRASDEQGRRARMFNDRSLALSWLQKNFS